MPEPFPSKVGRYEIQRELGRGMMGIVYEAFDPALDRRIALKTIQLAFTVSEGDSASFQKRFLTEARVAARLSHPGIVVVHDVGQDPATGTLYIALEFLKGRTLAEVVDAGKPIDWREALEISRRVAQALHHAHAEGVIHRDIKPANIMILPSGEPKIMDFGIARVETSQLTATGQFFGTPLYMSPEQALGRRVDARSDLFSLGSVAYALLTGRQPFEGAAVPLILMRVVQDEPPPPTRLVPSLPPDVDYLIARALAKDPADRYPDGRAMTQDLEDILAGLPPRHKEAWEARPRAEGTLVASTGAGEAGREGRGATTMAQRPPSGIGDAVSEPESQTVHRNRRAAPAALAKRRPRPPRRGFPWRVATVVVAVLAAAAIGAFIQDRLQPQSVAAGPTPTATMTPSVPTPTATMTPAVPTPPIPTPTPTMTPPVATPTPAVTPPIPTPTPAVTVAPPATARAAAPPTRAPRGRGRSDDRPGGAAPPAVSASESRSMGPPPTAEPPRPATDTADPVVATESAAGHAQVELDLEHSLKHGRLRVWVDESLVVDDELDSRVTKKLVALKIRKGHLEQTLQVPAGRHEIRVEVSWDDNVKTSRIWANFLPGSTRRLKAKIGTGIGGLVKKDLDLEWK